MVDVISARLARVAAAVAVEFSAITGPEQLERDVNTVKLNHPYAGAEKMGFTVDWKNLRAVKFKSDEGKRHLERLLVRAQFQFEAVLGRVLAVFWKRVLHALQGIRVASIRKLRRRDDVVDAGLGTDAGGDIGGSSSSVAVRRRTAVAMWSIEDAEQFLRDGDHHHDHHDAAPADEEGSDALERERAAQARKVARAWLEEGVHLRVDLHVFLRGDPVTPMDLADADRYACVLSPSLPSRIRLSSPSLPRPALPCSCTVSV